MLRAWWAPLRLLAPGDLESWGKLMGLVFFLGMSERQRVEGARGGLQPSRLPCGASSKGLSRASGVRSGREPSKDGGATAFGSL